VCEIPDFRFRGTGDAGTGENINRDTKPESVENKRRADRKARMLLIIKALAVFARMLFKINRLSVNALGIQSATEWAVDNSAAKLPIPSLGG
jgi:hypothetical protein